MHGWRLLRLRQLRTPRGELRNAEGIVCDRLPTGYEMDWLPAVMESCAELEH
jgi:hypothetical protein